MKWIALVLLFASALGLVGCKPESGGTNQPLVVEKVDAYKPNLPAVPTIPKPSVPETYPDGSYSIYGLRKANLNTMDSHVTVTAYVLKISQKPVCPKGEICPPATMPHLLLADVADEKVEKRLLKVVGYADSYLEMEEEAERVKRNVKTEPLPDGTVDKPVIFDWEQGRKYRVKGKFTRQSMGGFMDADGLLDFAGRTCIDCATPEELDKDKKKDE